MPQLARWLTLIEQYDYEVVHRHGKQHANADGLSRRPTMSPTADDRQVQVKIVQIESEIPSARNAQRIQSARVLNNDEESTLVKSVYDDATTASTDAEQLSASTDHLCPKAVRTVDLEPEVVHLLVRENLANDQCTDAELGRVVQLCLEADERPSNEGIQTDSELTKKMIVKWILLYLRGDQSRRINDIMTGSSQWTSVQTT